MIKATRPDASESRTRTPFAMPECEHQSANHRSRSPFFTVGHKINTIPNNSLKRHMSATRFPSATVGESYGIISSMNGFRPTFYGRPHKPLPGLEVNNSSGFHQMNSYSAPGCTVNSSLGGSTMNNSGYPVRVHDHLSRPWEQPHEVIVRHFPARNTCVGQRFQKGCHSASKCSDLRDVNGYNDPTQEKFKGDVWKQPWQNPTALIKGAPKKGGFVSKIHFLV